ncbi:hypothetical protein [Nonomuraea sp. NPDC049129]|uniref:hypothetical protein n=1 Tax=Nonomuraea sp. NPDC049129 TaxID=3155272 RepID=UPI0033FD0FE2
MELTVNQKISLSLALKARINHLESLNQEDEYIRAVLAECRELYELLDNTKTVAIEFWSDYVVAA